MPTFIRLANLTNQAVRNVQTFGAMLDDARKAFEPNRCKLVQASSTLGAYNIVAVVEGPDEATLMKASALIAKQGNLRGVRTPAIPMKDPIDSVK